MTTQTIAGILNIDDSERTYVEGVGQRQMFEATQEYTAMVNQDLAEVSNLFIEKVTEDHAFRAYLPGDGELQEGSELGRPGERKVTGSWDVALPIRSYSDALGTSRIDLAYMTIADYQRHVDAIVLRAKNTLRKQIMRALFDNTAWDYTDKLRGTLSIKPLASGDGTLYPPVAGGLTAAEATHYAEAGYVVSAISDTNNPIKTISNALRSRWGTDPSRVRVVLIGEDSQDKVEALTDFVEIDDPYISKGVNAESVLGIPANVPGQIIGRSNGAFVSVWPWMPSTYMMGIDAGVEKPLQMRVDPSFTNLPQGLTLIAESDAHPLAKSDWEWRFGLGVVNRLNGYVLEVAAGGSYSIPTGYNSH